MKKIKFIHLAIVFFFVVSLFLIGTKEVSGTYFGDLLTGGTGATSTLAVPDTLNSTKTVSWSNAYSGKALVTHAILNGSWWAPALYSPNVSVLYKASANKVGTGSTLVVGDKITFMPGPFLDTDTSWNGTGYGWDSPYGHFVPSAGDPGLSCAAGDYINDSTAYASWPYGGYVSYTTKVYIPFSVNIPTATFSPTSGMTCDPRQSDGSTTCTVTQPGTVSGKMIFPINYGKFYYAYSSSLISGCFKSDMPLYNYSGAAWLSCDYSGGCPAGSVGSEFNVDIPEKTITFSFAATGVYTNRRPTMPVITPQPFSGGVNTSYPFAFTATDPDGDLIRYAIDWNRNGVADQYTGYASSGSSQSASNPPTQWPTISSFSWANVKTFQVRTEDIKGGTSSWATAQVTLSSVSNGVCGPATLVPSGPPPTIGLCTSGTATLVSQSGNNWTWGCNGSGGGTSTLPDACITPVETYTLSAERNPLGTGTGTITDTIPTATSIDSALGRNSEPVSYNATRTLRATPTSSSISWSGCTSVFGDDCTVSGIISARSVTATFTRLPEPGICGSSNNGSFDTLNAGSAGICSSGAVSSFTLSGTTYSWNCNGSFGSPVNVSCSATQTRNYNWIEVAP